MSRAWALAQRLKAALWRIRVLHPRSKRIQNLQSPQPASAALCRWKPNCPKMEAMATLVADRDGYHKIPSN